MKTIKEIGEIYGVSIQTVYKRLNRLKEGEYREFKNGKMYITENGIDIMFKGFKPKVEKFKIRFKDNGENEADKGLEGDESALKATEPNSGDENRVSMLQERIDFLERELVEAREDNRRLLDMLDKQINNIAELSRNNQVLLGVEQAKTNPAMLTEKAKRGFMYNIFNVFRRSGEG